MKRRLATFAIALLLFLSGCSGGNSELKRAMALRAELLASNGYSFDTMVTADYGDKIYTFGMNCQVDNLGNLSFTVTEPESIAGITGTVSESGGKLTFDDTALAFELLADGQVTPVSAPWILVHTLHSGYLTSCCAEGDGLLLTIDDSYEDDALNLTIWLGENDLPTQAEILWQGRRILSLEVKNFGYL